MRPVIKFKFIISEIENLFFFVSNLSEWHFSCRPTYNIEWINKTGPLIKKEVGALAQFKQIMRKHGFYFKNGKSQYLGQYFFVPNEESKWCELSNFVSQTEYEDIKEILNIFTPRFKKIWREEKLVIWQNALQRKVQTTKVKLLFKDIECFIPPREQLESINVHLLASPSKNRTAAGGANLGNQDVTLEVPILKLNEWNLEYALALLAHEISHIYIDHSSVLKLIEKYPKRSKDFLKEIMADTCAPYGFFCQKYFKRYEPITDMLLPALTNNKNLLTKNIIWMLYPITAQYATTQKSMDKNFIDKLFDIITICNSRN
jgi:hypothetical protein